MQADFTCNPGETMLRTFKSVRIRLDENSVPVKHLLEVERVGNIEAVVSASLDEEAAFGSAKKLDKFLCLN